MDKGLTITISAHGTGGAMHITWDGDPEARPVFMGSDEMMTLTPRETELREAIMSKLAGPAISARTDERKGAEPEKRPALVDALLVMGSFFATIALIYATQPGNPGPVDILNWSVERKDLAMAAAAIASSLFLLGGMYGLHRSRNRSS